VRARVEHVEPSPRQSWTYQVRTRPAFPFTWHFHAQLELMLMVSGQGTRLVGDSREHYGPGDLVLLGAGLPHGYDAPARPGGAPHTAIVIHFDGGFLGSRFLAAPEFEPLIRLFERAARGLAFSGRETVRAARRLRAIAHLQGAAPTLELLYALSELAAAPSRQLAGEGFRGLVDDSGQALIERVCGFLNQSFQSPLTLEDVAAVAHLTPSGLSRSFRRATGRSVLTYLIEVRIAAACRMLIDSDQAISEIAAASGYRSLANFNRQFRRLKGMSPREFRAAYTVAAGRRRHPTPDGPA
jgi:AraC-like DNA-binding protein